MRDRRLFLITLAGLLAAPRAAGAQPARRVPRIGYLVFSPLTDPPSAERLAFVEGLRDRGYVDGRSIRIEYRAAAWNGELLEDLAEELVKLRVDLIVAVGSQAVAAARRATALIPIVFPVVPDPVATGFVASLARPGGNATGLTSVSPDLSAKRLELLKETVPGLSGVAVLWNSQDPGARVARREHQEAARRLGLTLHSWEVRGSEDFLGLDARLARDRPGALSAVQDPLISFYRDIIVDFAARHRLPAVYGLREFVDAGGLMSYGANIPDLFRRSAVYVDRVLKGARPSGLPVEQPTRFEFRINRKAARALGLTIPPAVLARADEIIE